MLHKFEKLTLLNWLPKSTHCKLHKKQAAAHQLSATYDFKMPYQHLSSCILYIISLGILIGMI